MNKVDFTDVTLSVENIGGIDYCQVTFDRGVTVLAGANATNRTSLLRSLAGVLGGSTATIKGGCSEGFVSLDMNNAQYTRKYQRQNDEVSVDGKPYSDKQDLVDLFVSLLENNRVRQTVRQGGDLSDILLQPIDTQQIERRINERVQERNSVDEQIAEIERKRKELPQLEEQRQELREKHEAVEAEIEQVQATVNGYDQNEYDGDAEEAMTDLEELREELNSTQHSIETQRSSIDALRDERDKVHSKLADLSIPREGTDEVEQRRTQLKKRERSLSSAIDRLSGIVEFSETLLTEDINEFRTNESDITASLDPSSQLIECWTCGSDVPKKDIIEELKNLREEIETRQAERKKVETELEECQNRLKTIRERRKQKQHLESRQEDTSSEIERREQRIETLEEEASEIRDRIASVEGRIEETEGLRGNNLVESYQRLSKLEYRHGQLGQEICTIENKIEDLQSAIDDHDKLKTRRTELADEIESLRTRIEDIEIRVVDEFNQHVQSVLSLLNYENLDRVWIERIRTNSSNDNSKSISEFHLHIVRSTSNGTVYESTIKTLSESEREVIGLVVALAGYLAHEIYEEIPFLLLDSLEAIDANRIARLIDYISEYSPFLVVALLKEDEQMIDDNYQRIAATELRRKTG